MVSDYSGNSSPTKALLWKESSCQFKIKNSTKKANLNLNIHAYNLRHSFGSHLKESGLPIEEIQLRMGHNSINTTLGYAKVEKPKQIISPLDDEYFTDNKIICNIT